MTGLVLLAWFVVAPAALGGVFWIAAAVNVSRIRRARLSVRVGLSRPAPSAEAEGNAASWPSLSVIVPAHDEEAIIETCATSLRRLRYEPLEIIFVLDRCTDGTRAILRRHESEDARIRIIVNEACPDGWAGKCNAARIGAEHATGSLLIFTDADTQFDPDLARAAVALAHDRDLGLLSLLSTLRFEHAFERIAQPVASMNLIRMYPLERPGRPGGTRPFANGQFMLFTRAWYERIGGHAAVRDDLLEDIAFARALNRAGGTGGVFLADGMLTCSMYESLDAFREGWKRIFIEACKRKPSRLRKNRARVLSLGVVVPLFQIAAMVVAAALLAGGETTLAIALMVTVAVGWTVQGFTLARIYTLAGAPKRAALLYPVGAWIVGRIMGEGARDLETRRPIRWGGRSYVLEPRD